MHNMPVESLLCESVILRYILWKATIIILSNICHCLVQENTKIPFPFTVFWFEAHPLPLKILVKFPIEKWWQ